LPPAVHSLRSPSSPRSQRLVFGGGRRVAEVASWLHPRRRWTHVCSPHALGSLGAGARSPDGDEVGLSGATMSLTSTMPREDSPTLKVAGVQPFKVTFPRIRHNCAVDNAGTIDMLSPLRHGLSYPRGWRLNFATSHTGSPAPQLSSREWRGHRLERLPVERFDRDGHLEAARTSCAM
jgi:hypothetical protein